MASGSDKFFSFSTCQKISKDPLIICKKSSSADRPPNQDQEALCYSLEERDHCVCPLHFEKRKLFCLDHEQPVCPICKDTQAHRHHRVSSMTAVMPDLRGKLQRALDLLKDRLKSLNKSKDQFTSAAAHIRAQAEFTAMQIQAQFKRLYQFLQDEEAMRIQAVREEELKKTQHLAEKLTAITNDVATLTQSIRAAEAQLKGNDSSFPFGYKDVVDRVHRCILIDAPNLGAKTLLDQAKHTGNMAFRIWNNMKKLVQFSPVILDPNTAHPEMMMSEDLCGVGQTRKLNLPQNPERFFYYNRVLGWEGWNQGPHSWIVQVPDDSYWAIGVASESVLGRGLTLTGYWELVVMNGHYKAYAGFGSCKELNMKRKVENVRVKLNFDRGRLSFYDADAKKLIHRFTYTFKDRLFPYFETHNNVKLKILPISEIGLNIVKQ